MWLVVVLIWAVLVVLAFTLGGSGAGSGAFAGGLAGTLGAYLAIRSMRRRGWPQGKSD